MVDLGDIGERERLKPRKGEKPYWQRLRARCYLGFQPSKRRGRGCWFARAYDPDAGKYSRKALGDFGLLSGHDVYSQAKRDAEEWADTLQSGGVRSHDLVTFAPNTVTLRRRSIPRSRPYGIDTDNSEAQVRPARAPARGRDAIVQDIEAKLGGRFSKLNSNASALFEYTPGEKLKVGDTIRQFFTLEDPLSSIRLVFFTYCKSNSSRIRVTLSSIQDDLRFAFILGRELSGDQIQDGQPCNIFCLSSPIEDSAKHVYQLKIDIVSQEKDAELSAACILSGVSALTIYSGAIEKRGLALQINMISAKRFGRKLWAYVSSCPGASHRYRCINQAEMISEMGFGVDVFPATELPWKFILDNYNVVTIHRLGYDEQLVEFIEEARRRLIVVIFDTDDLIFSIDHLHEIDAYSHMNMEEKSLFEDGIKRFSKAISMCDIVSVSTSKLRDAVLEKWPQKKVWVSRNIVSTEMVIGAKSALAATSPNQFGVRIGYFSGTKTHQRDFLACSAAIQCILRDHEEVTLVIVGHLELGSLLEKFPGRIEIIPFVEWQYLPEIYRSIDINIYPLEIDNTFTASKSEIKWLEAGLLGVPTVASRVGAYEEMVIHGVDGLLCDTTDQWIEAISILIKDPILRASIGRAAKARIEAEYVTTRATAERFGQIKSLFEGDIGSAWQRPTIAFVMMAPIAQAAGGYKKIFMLANHLKTRFEVTVYVEPCNHLAGMDDHAVRQFVSDFYGFEAFNIIVGHFKMEPADIFVATEYASVQPVIDFPDARVRTYFVQDYEPDFFEGDEVRRLGALRTYEGPLSLITIGKYLGQKLEHFNRLTADVPFAVDKMFFEVASQRPKLERRRVLFFARPHIPRRNFSLGVKALKLVAERRPDVEIALYGLDDEHDLGFQYENLGVLGQDQLAANMAQAQIHLSFSMTNISTCIYEAMAAGCACIEADVESVRSMVRDGVDCLLAEPTPDGVANALLRLIDDPAYCAKIAAEGRQSVAGMTEHDMCKAFEDRLLALWLGSAN